MTAARATGARLPLGELRRRLALAGLLMASTFLLGVVGYRLIGGDDATWVDAIYMTANALTTTGFRESVDVEHHPGGMTFTIVLLIFGTGTVVYFTSVFTAFVVEGDLTQGFRRRRMQRAIHRMTNHFIVCGAGPAGLAVVRELLATDRRAVLVVRDEEAAKRVEEELAELPLVIGDATDDATLVRAGIGRAIGVVICTPDDKDSLVTTIIARQLNPRARVVARASDERAAARLRTAGADAAVAPDLIGGMRMASELVRPTVVSFLDRMLRDTERNLRVEEIEIPRESPLAGRTIAEMDLRTAGNLLVLAVADPERGDYVYNPAPDFRVAEGAQLIVMGDPGGMRRVRKMAEGDGAANGVLGARPSALGQAARDA